MKKGLTEVVCILDRSGSMQSIITDAIGGINRLLEDNRKADDERKFTIVLFDDQYEMIYSSRSVKDIPDFTAETYAPRGMTAMYDAIGKTIAAIGQRYSSMNDADRPEKVIFAILTDGQENASKEYRQDRVKEMIEHQTQKYSWTFLFLAAGQDAVVSGTAMGISAGNTMNYSGTGKGTTQVYAMMSRAVSSVALNACASTESVLASMNNGSNVLDDDAKV
jgi:uncharacterized protein YegL